MRRSERVGSTAHHAWRQFGPLDPTDPPAVAAIATSATEELRKAGEGIDRLVVVAEVAPDVYAERVLVELARAREGIDRHIRLLADATLVTTGISKRRVALAAKVSEATVRHWQDQPLVDHDPAASVDFTDDELGSGADPP